MIFRRKGEYDADAASLETGLECTGETLTQQSMKDEADINVLVRRFGITGQLPVNVRVPSYADFDDVFDFATAQQAIIEANKSFMAMPAEVRARFGNDPHEFVMFCSDEKNIDEMVRMGLAVKKPEAATPPPADGVTS